MNKNTIKNRIYRRIISLIFAVSLIFTTNFTVLASEKEVITIDGSTLTKSNVVEQTIDNVTRGNILLQGVARLTNNGGGSVNVYGATLGAVVCDKVTLKMTLQRLQGSTWVDVKSFSDTAYNTSMISKSYNVKVTKGYYYRIKAACTATDNGVSESQMPITDGLWIG